MAAAVTSYTSDKIKIIGLILTIAVVFHHAHNLQFASGHPNAAVRFTESFFHYGLRGLAVPFFFVCSGYFLCARANFTAAWPGEIRKRTRSLLVPFLVWSGGWIVVMWILQSIPQLAPYFGRDQISMSHPAQIVDLMTFDPIPHPLWYMRDLFLLTLLSPLVVWAMSRRWSAAIYLTGAAALYYSVPSIEVREAEDLLFFGLGVGLAVKQWTVPAVPRAVAWSLLFAGLALISYHAWWVDTRHQESPWILNTAVLFCLPGIWWSYDSVATWLRVPAMLAASEFALFVYMGHEPLLTIMRKGLLRLSGETSVGLVTVWAGTGLAMVLGLSLVAWMLRTWLPGIYGLLTGGRLKRLGTPARSPAPAAVGISTATM